MDTHFVAVHVCFVNWAYVILQNQILKTKPRKPPMTYLLKQLGHCVLISFREKMIAKMQRKGSPSWLFALQNLDSSGNGKLYNHYTVLTHINSGLGLKENPASDVTWVNQIVFTYLE